MRCHVSVENIFEKPTTGYYLYRNWFPLPNTVSTEQQRPRTHRQINTRWHLLFLHACFSKSQNHCASTFASEFQRQQTIRSSETQCRNERGIVTKSVTGIFGTMAVSNMSSSTFTCCLLQSGQPVLFGKFQRSQKEKTPSFTVRPAPTVEHYTAYLHLL